MIKDLPLCHWRGSPIGEQNYECKSPKLVVGTTGISADFCQTCYCRDHDPIPAMPAVGRCPHLSRRVRDERGQVRRVWCAPCGGAPLDLFGCSHPATENEVTLLTCKTCPYQPGRSVHIDRVFLINLPSRTDRLAAFRDRQNRYGWNLPQPEIVQAVAGDVVGVPPYFRQGGGAWGCLRSHVGILERCLMSGVESALVLEDDAEWFPEIWAALPRFFESVPADWSQIMLGGQHLEPAESLGNGVVRCKNTQRTHAYIIRGAAMKSLLRAWYSCAVHLDWVMGGDWQRGWPVYAPEPFLFGQAGGKSDISGRLLNSLYWNPPTNAVVAAIDAPRGVIDELRTHGLHFGFKRNADGVDSGLARVAAQGFPSDQLSTWLSTLLWEVASMRGRLTAVWCPGMNLDIVQRVHGGRVVVARVESAAEALALIGEQGLVRSFSTSHVLLLRGDRDAAEGAVGFHRGYWVDVETGYDRGIVSAAAGDAIVLLRQWGQHTFEEAERMQRVPMVWHPGITAAQCRAAFPERLVVELKAARPSDVEKLWRENVP